MIGKAMRILAAGAALFAAVSWSAAADEPAKDEEGFVSLFNGKDLSGWDGDTRLWTVKDGVIRGETTEQVKSQGNTFLVCQAGTMKNFVLKLKFRVGDANNSGVQFRSVLLPAKEGAANRWVVSGYQAEVVEGPGKVGFLYDEKRRGGLVNVGDLVVVERQGEKVTRDVVSKVGDVEQLIRDGYYKGNKGGEWNEYAITCRGNHIMMELNGFQTVEMIDNDPEQRTLEGLLALQIHGGAPMWVEFKDIRVRKLAENYGQAVLLFNGKDLTGWKISSEALKDTFGVKDGAIAVTGKPAGYVRTEADYANYVLRLQLRHQVKCNCGVLVRMHGEDKVWPNSIECQGMKDNMGDLWNIGEFPMKTDPERTKGRRTVKLHESNEKPVGQWNQYEILLNKGDLLVKVNGLVQNLASECKEIPGKICLQSEGGAVDYRNIVLIPILEEKSGG